MKTRSWRAQLYTGSVLLRLVGQLDLQGKSQGSALRLSATLKSISHQNETVHRIDVQTRYRHRGAVGEVVKGIDCFVKRLPDKLFFLAYKPAKTVIDIGFDIQYFDISLEIFFHHHRKRVFCL